MVFGVAVDTSVIFSVFSVFAILLLEVSVEISLVPLSLIPFVVSLETNSVVVTLLRASSSVL